MARSSKRRIKGHPAHKVAVSVDPIADAAVRRLMERESLSYSGALCALATHAALGDKDLFEHIKAVVVRPAVKEKMARDGWHPSLSAVVAKELVTGEPSTEKLTWS